MILTFAEDFSTDVTLDTQLTAVPESGIYFNRGVHPLLTLKNLLTFLPVQELTFSEYAAGTTYGKYEDTEVRTDIVTSGSVIYESIASANKGNTPVSSPLKWLPTNVESLRIKNFIRNSKENMLSALSFSRRLIDSQYIYNVGTDSVTLSGDFSGWVFEPKGSDYVKIRINQIALQANTESPVSLYVINQGVLLETITLNPDNGVLSFEDVTLEITSKGRVYLVFPSQSVRSQSAYNDALKYNGFVCYPVTGVGSTAATATYNISNCGNGLNFNVSAYADSTVYINNNLIDFAKFTQSQFEIDFLRMLVTNSNARSTRQERALDDTELKRIYFEITDIQQNTIARRYTSQLKRTLDAIQRTFDREIQEPEDFNVEIGVI